LVHRLDAKGAQVNDILIRVHGSQLVRGAGTPVVLRGFGLGGWMNMENFITGYPSNEAQQRAALRQVLGEDGYRRFFDRFLDAFFTEADAEFLAQLGVNCVRLPFNYRHFEDDDRPFALKDEGFRVLDRAVAACAKHRIYTILDLHALPGCQNQHWHSDNPTHWAQFWTHTHFQDRVVHLWEALAQRYRDNPWVAGYNPINEPADPSGAVIAPFYRRLERAIRAVDPHHVLFLDGNRYSLDFDMFGEPLANCVYTAHDYALPGFIDGGGYPGTTRGTFVDRAFVERTFLERTAYMRRTGTPIWIGEFGPVFVGDAARDAERYQLLTDQLELYRQHGASWSLWTYKDIGLQGLAFMAPDAPYLQRIAPVLAKKARLGVDAWGSLDTGVRHLLEPIERTVRAEFPDFQPFPFGIRSWIDTLVRHILLAEPLVGDFARCFQGVTPPEAEALGDGFRFDRCRVREPLAQLLRRFLAD
jgi:aryl-phospho-beta-D-glucosidase BglC (GH1 family)